MPAGTFLMAGRDPGGTRVVVVYVGDDPGAGSQTRVDLTVDNLPWGAAATFDMSRYEVSDATNAAGEGVKLAESASGLTGGTYSGSALFGPGPGAGRLIVWELVKNP